MIDATMPWRLLFLAAASVVVTASLPQPDGGVRSEPSLCAQLNTTEEVVGVTSLGDTIAVASRFRATLHKFIRPGQCRKTDEISFPTAIVKFTEFKLLNDTSLFYCSTTDCTYCRFGQTHLCRELEIHLDKRNVDISTVVATQTTDGRRILVKIVFANLKSGFFVFEEPLLEEDRIVPISSAFDENFIQRQQVALGFNLDGFSYFVLSAYQAYEPTADMNKDWKRDDSYRVKIMRMCDSDATYNIESRVEISLACPGIDDSTNRGVAAATYFATDRKVVVVFSSNSIEDIVCSYPIDEVNKEIEHTWTVCQNTSQSAKNDCKYTPEKEHCHIFTRMGDHRSVLCSKYGADLEKTFNMCNLNEYTSTAYRYGWLESYISLNGTPMARIDNRGLKYNQVYVDDLHSSFFFTGDERFSRVPYDGANMNEERIAPSLVKFYKPSSRFGMAHVTSSSFLLTDQNRVIEHPISCQSLYKDCDALAHGGFTDPLQCLFCTVPDNESGGYVMDKNEKTECKNQLLQQLCPPVIRNASQNPVRREEWIIVGESLQTLSNPTVLVCNQPCHINYDSAGEKRFSCTLQSSSVLDPTCPVKFEGQLESYPKFSVTPIKYTRDSSTQTNSPISNGNSAMSNSRTWKIVVAVVAIVLIVTIIIIIILGARKYLGMRNQKGNGSLGMIPFGNGDSYSRSAARNTYLSTDPSGMPFANNMSPAHAPAYERLFREIDSRLKIPSDQLLLEKQIGKGHFGVVIKGTYNPAEGTPRAVACKTLSGHVAGGISEFVNEGLMMDRFDHPRVMTLVGISFNEERMPIIVTDYMENGDLAKYLRDVKNKPTLRDLLNFTHEIALGMQYLHDNKFIHRDLAARNCMLDRNLHVKVADFGLCREATSQDEYLPIHSGREMPLRWMAPEALEREQFTMAGDVWAFGVVIWEVMTRGMNPYPNLQAYVLFEFLKAGKRMGKPDFCPDILFRVMLDCWHGEPTLRPTFKELPTQIEEIIDVLSSNSRVQMNAEYEQCNSVRNSRAASSSATTPITHHAISHVHSLPMENSPTPSPV